MFTNCMVVTVRDTLHHHENHSLDSRQGLPLLQYLSKDGTLYDHVRSLCDYMTTKAEHVTLKDYLALAHFFRYVTSTQKESDSMHIMQVLVKLTTCILQQSTEEIEPIVRDICSSMAACSLPLRKVMQKIIERSAVESSRVPLGCEAPEVFELVGILLNDSSEEYMARALTINSVRRTLQKVRDRSSRPELLMLYDILLEETQMKYIEERFSTAGAANLVSEIHKLTIVLESLELSNVCSYELRSLRSSLDSIWRQHEESKEYFESIKGVLLDLLDTALSWLSKYSCPEAFQNLTDYIGIKDTLAGIGSKYVRLLMPIMSKSLKYLDRLMQVEHYIPLCKGTAVGKIVRVRSLTEVPAAYAAVIVILSESPTTNVVPESVKALIILMDIDFDSKLLSYCHSRKVVLAVVAKKRIPEHLEQCVQVHVFDDCIEFL